MTNQPQNLFDFLPETQKPAAIAKPEKTDAAELAKLDAPMNPTTGNFYKGAQVETLLEIMLERGYCGKFAGFMQWKEAGRSVKKGEKAIKIMLPFTKEKGDGSSETKFMARSIFAIEQTEIIN